MHFDTYDCDNCRSKRLQEISVTRNYLANHPLYVCSDWRFVYVRQRDTAENIIDFFNHWNFDTLQYFQEGREKQL